MATIKSYSDLEQSRKLAEILPLKSADMYYPCKGVSPKFGVALSISNNIPCWSLAALLSAIPIRLNNGNLRFRMDIDEKDTNIWYQELMSGMTAEGFDITNKNFVDACYEMILKLHELNLL